MSYPITPTTQQKPDSKNKPKKQQNFIKSAKSLKANKRIINYRQKKFFVPKGSSSAERRDSRNDEVDTFTFKTKRM
jgi:hypothetical protein